MADKLIRGFYENGDWNKYGDRLYNTTGQNTDGSIDQKTVTDALDNISLVKTKDYNGTDIGTSSCYINGSNKYITNKSNYAGVHIQNDLSNALRGKYLRVTPQSGTGKHFIIAFCQNKPNNNDTVVYSGTVGYTSRIFGTDNTVGMYLIPNDTQYIYFQKISNNVNVLPSKIEVFERQNVSNAISTANNESKGIESEVNELIGLEDLTSLFTFTSKKYICARQAEPTQTQVVGNAVDASATTTQCTTGYVDISGYSKLKITIVNSTADNLISGLCFYDSSNNVISTICRHSSTVTDNVAEYVDVPSTAKYVRTTKTTASGSTAFSCYGVPAVSSALKDIDTIKSVAIQRKLQPTMNWKDWHMGWTYSATNHDFEEYTGTGKTNTRSLWILPHTFNPSGRKVRVNFDNTKFYVAIAEFTATELYIDSTNLTRIDSAQWITASGDYQFSKNCNTVAMIIKKADDSTFTTVDDGDIEIVYDDYTSDKQTGVKTIQPEDIDWKRTTYYDDQNASWNNITSDKRAAFILPWYVVAGSQLHISMESGYQYVAHEFERYDLALGYNSHIHHLYQGGWLSGDTTITLQQNCEVLAIIVRKSNDGTFTLKNATDNLIDLTVSTQDGELAVPTLDGVYSRRVKESGNYYGEKISLRHVYERSALYQLELDSRYSYLSSMDVYGDYIVAVYPETRSGGTASSTCDGSIYNRKTREKIADINFPLGDYAIPHANTACFGVEFATGNTDFPLFYISQWNKAGGCLVYNITKVSDSEFSAELVQAIMPDNGITESTFGVKVRGDWVIDKENGFLYSVRYKYDSSFTPVNGNANNTMVTKFALPTLSDGDEVTLGDSDILDSFILPPTPVMQDKCMLNGKIYLLCGWTGSEAPNSQKIYVIDVAQKYIVSVVDLTQYGQEPECICIDEDSLLYTYFPDSSLFRLKFD